MSKPDKTKYIHYGSSNYDKNKFEPVRNITFRNKPKGGLWASPLNTKNGWEQWNKDNFDDITYK